MFLLIAFLCRAHSIFTHNYSTNYSCTIACLLYSLTLYLLEANSCISILRAFPDHLGNHFGCTVSTDSAAEYPRRHRSFVQHSSSIARMFVLIEQLLEYSFCETLLILQTRSSWVSARVICSGGVMAEKWIKFFESNVLHARITITILLIST